MVGTDPIAAMIEQSLAGIATPAVSPEAQPAAPTPVATPEPAAVEPPTPVETPVETAPPETVIEDPDTPEQLLGGVLDPNSTRGQKIWHAYSLVRDLVKPEAEGGIGHEPTVEDVRAYHGNHLTLTQNAFGF